MKKAIMLALGAMLIIILFSFVTAIVVMIGWNMFAPAVGVSTISYWPAFGLSLLIGMAKGNSSSS